MGIFDEIVSKEAEWENAYEGYLGNVKGLERKAQNIFEELRSYVDGINTIKQKLIGPMNLMNEFLGGIGQVDTLPAYKDVCFEHVPGYAPAAALTSTNSKKYTNLESEYDTKTKRLKKKLSQGIFGPDDFSSRNMKSYYTEITSKMGNEEVAWSHDLSKRKANISELELELEIAKLYNQVFSVVEETVEQVILKEIPFIRAFLYAQGVLEAVKAGNAPSASTPAHIKKFRFSSKYKRHFNFVKNTHDFYTLLINYYQNDYLSSLLSQKDKAQETASKELGDVENKSRILKADSLMWRK